MLPTLPKRIAILSSGVACIPNLRSFLPECTSIGYTKHPDTRRHDAIAGWGHKPTAELARKAAAELGLPYISLEDGILRSEGLAVTGAPPLCMSVDLTGGVYYSALRPSAVETTLSTGFRLYQPLLAEATTAADFIRRHRITKYNDAPEISPGLPHRRKARRVLLVDQTAGDASIYGGRADASTFKDMLNQALAEDVEIVLRPHPDVLAGKCTGIIVEDALARGALLPQHHVNPWVLLDEVDEVWTVTSGLGFEALLAGLPVRSFGMPFWAGWGASDDRLSCHRRRVRCTPVEILAAQMLHSRCVDPISGAPASFLDMLERMRRAVRARTIFHGSCALVGMRRWKRKQLASFVRPSCTTLRAVGKLQALKGNERPLLWGAKIQTEGAIRFEDGFLRSTGLGSDFHKAISFTADRSGVHYDPTRPSDLEKVLSETNFTVDLLLRAEKLRRRIISSHVTKYNLKGEASILQSIPPDREIILVPGQVADDASIQLGCTGSVRTDAQLLAAARTAEPKAFIIYKPHPDVIAGNRSGGIDDPKILTMADLVVEQGDMAALLDRCDAVHTMTSLTGFEALIREKRVVCHGAPFYAGWTLTTDLAPMPPAPRRGRRLSINALVAGALVLYPLYVDPKTGFACSPEEALERIASSGQGRINTYPQLLRKAWRLAKFVGASM